MEKETYKCRKQLNSTGKIADTRKESSGKSLERELSDKEKLEQSEVIIKLHIVREM